MIFRPQNELAKILSTIMRFFMNQKWMLENAQQGVGAMTFRPEVKLSK